MMSIKLLCNLIEITLRHGYSPVNLQHIFRTPFTKNTSRRLLLKSFGTLRSKLGTKFWKYLLKVSSILKSSVTCLPFSITDIFLKLFDSLEKKLFVVFHNFLFYSVFYASTLFQSSLINWHIYFFAYHMFFLTLSHPLLRHFS